MYCVLRPTPAMHVSTGEDERLELIQDDATRPPEVVIDDSPILSLRTRRSDSDVANFYWVTAPQLDLISDLPRKLAALDEDDQTVNLAEYPNTSDRYYGTRPMYADTQLGADSVTSMTGGLDATRDAAREVSMEDWLRDRRERLVEMTRDNIVLETGTARIKGGPMRPDGLEFMKAGDYAIFRTGNITWRAYITSITDEYLPFQGYTTTLTFERGTGYATRATMESGRSSPWLAEQARRL